MSKFKFIVPKSIYILIYLSVILNILRVVLFGKMSFIYVIWNIFLAFLPFVISSILLNFENNHKLRKTIFLVFGIIWLLLIPNSPYIVTDLIHIGEVRSVPVVFDAFLLFSSAWVGLLLGMYSINHMEQILKKRYSQKIASLLIFGSMVFVSFGIYLGRFLRFNSWDVFASPMIFIRGVGEIFANKGDSIEAIFYSLLFYFFLAMSYGSWKATQTK